MSAISWFRSSHVVAEAAAYIVAAVSTIPEQHTDHIVANRADIQGIQEAIRKSCLLNRSELGDMLFFIRHSYFCSGIPIFQSA